MQKKILHWAAVVVMGLVSLLGLLAIVHMLVSLPIPDHKGAEWLGAVGTVGAFIGTLWLATNETRRRHRDELLRGQLYAASLMLRLAQAHGGVRLACSALHMAALVDAAPGNILATREHLAKISLWTIDELIPLAVLSPLATGKLAEAADQIAHAIVMLDSAYGDSTLATKENRMVFARELFRLLSGTAEFIAAGIETCNEARVALHLESVPIAE